MNFRMTGPNSGGCRRWPYPLINLRAGSLSRLHGEAWEMMNCPRRLESQVVFSFIWVGSLVGIKVMRAHWLWQRLLWSFRLELWKRCACILITYRLFSWFEDLRIAMLPFQFCMAEAMTFNTNWNLEVIYLTVVELKLWLDRMKVSLLWVDLWCSFLLGYRFSASEFWRVIFFTLFLSWCWLLSLLLALELDRYSIDHLIARLEIDWCLYSWSWGI